MRAKYVLMTMSVLSLGMVSNVLADDVYVNLSVLDNLSQNPTPSVSQGPLFPIVSSSDSQKRPVRVAKKTRKAKKATAKASQEKIQIPAKTAVKVDVTPEKKIEPKLEGTAQEKQPIPETGPFKVARPEAKVDSVQAAPSIPVKSENLSQPEKAATENSAVATENTSVKEPETLSSLQAGETLATPAIFQPENALKTSVKEIMVSAPATESAVLQTTMPTTEKNEAKPTPNMIPEQTSVPSETKPSLLVNTNASEMESVANAQVLEIFFVEGNDELTPENEAEIDKIINAFENAKENKIAIYSFNLDDGEDSFRKKRISLNRAIAVRSYLLGKGYKNFSIKVVNITEADGKENSVRIEELK